MAAPTVSVVMPVYNGESYLEEAVSSILGQTLEDLELLTVDDGSTDSTPRILERLAAEDSRLRVLRCEHRGVVAADLHGARQALGTYIARMDADDVSLPERLERQLEVLESRPELGALGTWLRYIDEDGKPWGEWRTPVGSALVSWSLHFGTALANPTVLLRRALYWSAGGDRQEYRYTHDYDLWLRLAQTTQLDNIPEHLLLRRVHSSSDSMQNSDVQESQARELALMAVRQRLGIENAARGVDAIRRVIASPAEADEGVLRDAARFTERLFERHCVAVPLTDAEKRTVRLDAETRLLEIVDLARSRNRWLARRLVLQSRLLRRRRFGFA